MFPALQNRVPPASIRILFVVLKGRQAAVAGGHLEDLELVLALHHVHHVGGSCTAPGKTACARATEKTPSIFISLTFLGYANDVSQVDGSSFEILLPDARRVPSLGEAEDALEVWPLDGCEADEQHADWEWNAAAGNERRWRRERGEWDVGRHLMSKRQQEPIGTPSTPGACNYDNVQVHEVVTSRCCKHKCSWLTRGRGGLPHRWLRPQLHGHCAVRRHHEACTHARACVCVWWWGGVIRLKYCTSQPPK